MKNHRISEMRPRKIKFKKIISPYQKDTYKKLPSQIYKIFYTTNYLANFPINLCRLFTISYTDSKSNISFLSF